MVNRISELTEILPYVREFLGKTFVIKLGGEILHPGSLQQVAKQISLIHHIGIKVILVHGGGPQLNKLSAQLGLEPRMIAGRRITDDSSLEAAKMVFKGLLGTNLVAALRAEGASAVSLSGVDGALIRAKRRGVKVVTLPSGEQQSVDFGNVGDIQSIDVSLISVLLSSSIVPCIAPLAIAEDGAVLNINADTVASRLAQALRAEKLILMTNVEGVLENKTDPSSLVSYCTLQKLNEMISQGKISDGMLPKVEACMQAVQSGVSRTHIINGAKPGCLLMELFLNEGSGTMIVDDQERRRYEESVEAAA